MADKVSGTVLVERYLLEARIGTGGMAAVYRAIDLTTGKRVAVKILNRELLAKNPKEADRNVKRFRREAEILKRLVGDPYVVQYVDHGSSPAGDDYIAMELLEGEQLRFHIGRGKTAMGLRTFAFYARHVLLGLTGIHARGLIHRDVAPDNIVIVKTPEGLPWPKFLDFGIGKSVGGADKVTELITIMGKPHYFSPEQARGEELDPRSDIYSIGVVLYEMLTGHVPLEVHGVAELRRIQRDAPTPIRSHRDGARIPEELQNVIMRCLEKRAEDRPPLADLLAAVDRFSERLDAGEEFPVATSSARPDSATGPIETSDASADAGGPQEFAPGATIGRFVVREKIGRGGMGLVYLAWDPVLHREVAIKVATRVEGDKARRAILREARVSSHLKSENIVTIYDAGTEAGSPYIAMEYVRGPTLAQIIEDEAPLRDERFWNIARGILDGLVYAHEGETPVIHRDLKPANILCAGDVAKITDFGIATVTASHLGTGPRDSTGATGLEGSVFTMSPEQANNKPADHRSDIYALGCVFYMMATGRSPFQGNQIAILYQHVTKTPVAPSKVNPGLSPPELDAVILKCLEKEPADRFQSVREVRAAITPLFATGAPRSWQRSPMLLASLVALLIAGVAIVFAFFGPRGRTAAAPLTLRNVDGSPFTGSAQFDHLTRARYADLELVKSTPGDVRVRVSSDAGAAPVQTFPIAHPGQPTAIRISLPEAGTEGPSRISIEVDSSDQPSAPPVSFSVLQDLQKPVVSFRAYGISLAPRTTPIQVVRIQDLKAEIDDAGGIGASGDTHRVVHWNMIQDGVSITRELRGGVSGVVWSVLVKAEDRAGNPAHVSQLVEVAQVDAIIAAPAEGAAVADRTFNVVVTGVLADPSIEIGGLKERDLDLGPGAFGARVVFGARHLAAVAMDRTDDGYAARIELPPDTRSDAEFQLEIVFEGEVVKTSRHRFDRVPPLITAKSGSGVVTSAQTYSELPSLYVDVRSETRAEVITTIEDGESGVRGARVTVSVDGAPPQRVAVDDGGSFTLPLLEAEKSHVRIEGRDAAGNPATTEFIVVHAGQQVRAVRVGGIAPDAEGRVFVKSDRVPVRVAAVGVPAGDSAFAMLLGQNEGEPQTVRLDRVAGEGQVFETAELPLFPEGAGFVSRTLRVLFGKTSATARAPSRDLTIICDREPPAISVTLEGGTEEMRGLRVVGRFPRLVVKITDNVALADAGAEEIITWIRDARGPDVVVEPGPEPTTIPEYGIKETILKIDVTSGPPIANRFDFVVQARDRTQREPVKRSFSVQVAPSEVALVAVADRADFAKFGKSMEDPLALNRDTVPVTVRLPKASTSPSALIVKIFPEGRSATPYRFPLDTTGGAETIDRIVTLPKAPDGRLVEHGRMVFLLEEPGFSRQDEIATIFYLLDREPPTFEVSRNAAVLTDVERVDWIKVASAKSLKIMVSDGQGSGFGDASIEDEGHAVGSIEERTSDRIVFTLRDDDGLRGSAVELVVTVRDLAGNATPIRLRLARSTELLEVRHLVSPDGREPLRRGDLVIVSKPELRVTIGSESTSQEGVEWVVKRGQHEIEKGSVSLDPARSGAVADLVWVAAEGAEPYAVEFRARGPGGVEAKAFQSFRVLVDAAAPLIYLRAGAEAIASGRSVTVRSFDELRVQIVDDGAGSGLDLASVRVVAADGLEVGATLVDSRDGTTFRVKPAGPVGEGVYTLTLTAQDRYGTSGHKSFQVVVSSTSVPWTSISPASRVTTTQPTTQPTTRPESERTVANTAAREKDEERTGIKFAPVWVSADRNGPPKFFMSQTEVTNEQFLRYADAVMKDEVPAGLRWRADQKPVKKRIEAMRHRFDDFKRDPALPVVEVEPELAFGFSAWAGGRLPGRDEWTGAAGRFLVKDARYPVFLDRGTPRSDEFWMRDPTFANFQRGTREAKRVPVTELLRAHASAPFGIVGFAGNVAEWVTAEPRGRRILGTVGGSFKYPYTNEVHGARLDLEPALSAADAGIRVVWPAGEGKSP